MYVDRNSWKVLFCGFVLYFHHHTLTLLRKLRISTYYSCRISVVDFKVVTDMPIVRNVLSQVLWELLTHQIPFSGMDGLQVAWIVVECGTVSFVHFMS